MQRYSRQGTTFSLVLFSRKIADIGLRESDYVKGEYSTSKLLCFFFTYNRRFLRPMRTRLGLRLHGAIYRPDSFILTLRFCANLKAINYESTSLNRILADKSHRVIVAYRTNHCFAAPPNRKLSTLSEDH